MGQCQAMGLHRVPCPWGGRIEFVSSRRWSYSPRLETSASRRPSRTTLFPHRSGSCPRRGRRNRPRSWPWCRRDQAPRLRRPPGCLPHPRSYVLRKHAACFCGTGKPRPRLPDHAPCGVPPLAWLGPSRFRSVSFWALRWTGGIGPRMRGSFPSGRGSNPRESETSRPASCPRWGAGRCHQSRRLRRTVSPSHSGAESQLPRARWEDSLLSTGPKHLRAGAAPSMRDRPMESALF